MCCWLEQGARDVSPVTIRKHSGNPELLLAWTELALRQTPGLPVWINSLTRAKCQ